jgi:DNA-binding PadR family transcriptional regulator
VPADELTPSEYAVLALTAEAPIHGWALAVKLAKGGEIGSIWSLGRPLVYRSLERLEQDKLIKAVGLERGERGPHRVVYGATPKGRKVLREWLARPVDHVRDIRSLFLLKVVLSQRAGIDVEPLLVAQRSALVPFVTWLEAQLDDVDSISSPSDSTMLYFRLETAKTIVRFIDGLLDDPGKRAARTSPAKSCRRRSA